MQVHLQGDMSVEQFAQNWNVLDEGKLPVNLPQWSYQTSKHTVSDHNDSRGIEKYRFPKHLSHFMDLSWLHEWPVLIPEIQMWINISFKMQD